MSYLKAYIKRDTVQVFISLCVYDTTSIVSILVGNIAGPYKNIKLYARW